MTIDQCSKFAFIRRHMDLIPGRVDFVAAFGNQRAAIPLTAGQAWVLNTAYHDARRILAERSACNPAPTS